MVAVSVSIDVPDLAGAVAFYTGALGCEFVREFMSNSTIIAAGGVEIYLQEVEAGSKAASGTDLVRSYDRHWTPVHLDFGIADVQGAVERVLKLGGQCEGSDKGDWGEIAHCVDPYGNGFCIIRE